MDFKPLSLISVTEHGTVNRERGQLYLQRREKEDMKKWMGELVRRMEAGEDLVLVTVTAASGATPRGAGARMLVGQQGRICGTIGGGAVEFRSEETARTLLAQKRSSETVFSLTAQDLQKLGMICGGDAQVHFQYLPAGDEDCLSAARQAADALDRGRELWLVSDLTKNGGLQVCDRSSAPQWLTPHLKNRPCRFTWEGRSFFAERIGTAGKVYLFGGGHVAQALVPALAAVEFSVIVLEDRPEFADPALFPQAEQVLQVEWEHIGDYVNLTKEDYCCVMTRGHAYDTVVQAQIMKARPCYMGMIGSRTKGAAVRKALEEEYGFPPEEISRLVSPIGLSIGAQTPEEIAVSITAQMIQVRAEKRKEE